MIEPGFVRIYAFLNLFTHLIAALACFPFESRRQARMPGTRPYTWGIFIGLNAILVGGAFLAGGIGEALSSDPWALKQTIVAFQTVGGLTAVAAGYAAVRRWRVGLIVAILLTWNVLWWLGGFIYVWKRWAELRGTFNRPS